MPYGVNFEYRHTVETFTIGNGADGSSVDPVEFQYPVGDVVVKCEDCSNIAASTSLTALVGYEGDDTLCDLYEENAPQTQWSKGDLPTSGTLAFRLTHALGTKRLRLVLSNNASGGSVVFTIYAYAAAM